MLAVVELGVDIPVGPAGAVTLRAAALHHKTGENAMEGEVVVEAGRAEFEKILDVIGRDVVP